MTRLPFVLIIVAGLAATCAAQEQQDPVQQTQQTADVGAPAAEATAPQVATPQQPEAPAPEAQPGRPPLKMISDEDVNKALAPKATMGLTLREANVGFMNAMGALGGNTRDNHSGYEVEVLTPIAWITRAAREAARKYLPFGPAEITDEMKEPVLRVVVHPDRPEEVRGHAVSASADHVVLRSSDKKGVVQPVHVEPFKEEVKNAMGGSMELQGVVALFNLEAARAIAAADPKGEFFITVVGTRERDFKVKTKHFENLPGLR